MFVSVGLPECVFPIASVPSFTVSRGDRGGFVGPRPITVTVPATIEARGGADLVQLTEDDGGASEGPLPILDESGPSHLLVFDWNDPTGPGATITPAPMSRAVLGPEGPVTAHYAGFKDGQLLANGHAEVLTVRESPTEPALILLAGRSNEAVPEGPGGAGDGLASQGGDTPAPGEGAAPPDDAGQGPSPVAPGAVPVPDVPTRLPALRTDLVIRPLGDAGRYVVKDPLSGAFYTFGEQEHFLLTQLDGERDAEAICKAFEERFGEPLSEEDLAGLVELARGKGLLQPAGAPVPQPEAGPTPAAERLPPPRPRQSILFWRQSLFDPDRFFTWLEPKLRFVWTRAFLVTSAVGILLAAALVWANGRELVSAFPNAWRWQTAVVVWLTLVTATFCHEFAHGLTCKHYGGEVHEVGFLALFFLPCFYCNVSDAWLFKERSKRLWVTLAGGYFDLCAWAMAVFVWRLSAPESLINYLALVVLSVLGARVFFNFNPLLKLDGYYLLSDWLEVPNLRQRAWDRVAGWLRCLLWGAPRPAAVARGRFLLIYGLTSWLFSVFFLTLMLAGFYRFLAAHWGVAGAALTALLGAATLPGMFKGLGGGEVRKMFQTRFKRAAAWLLLPAGAAALLFLVRMEDRASAPFEVRPAARAEIRAPVAGFLREVHLDEGQRAASGGLVARLEVPDLDSRLAQARAAVRESEAKLRLLKVGARPEEVAEQRQRVERAVAWRDLAERDLRHARKTLGEDLARLQNQIEQYEAEQVYSADVLDRSRRLMGPRAVSLERYREAEMHHTVAGSKKEQARALKRARQEAGTRVAETELARRKNELADARATLRLLEAGSRPEEIDAERARLTRLREDVYYLEGQQRKLEVRSPVAGLVTTPRVKEKIGRYLREGDLICEVEEPDLLEADVGVDEADLARVEPGQVVELKSRADPFQTIKTTVDRIAPRAVSGEPPATAPKAARGELPGTVTVYCRVVGVGTSLRPGMTGHARVLCGRRPVGELLGERVMRLVRTELWW